MSKIKLRPCDTRNWNFNKKTLPDLATLHHPDGTREEIDTRNKDYSNDDLSVYDIADFDFDDKTIWPTDPKKLPQGFEHRDEIMELGKNPGLGVRSLHARGIDGTSMRMAIVDQWLSDHEEYHDNLVHYEEVGFDPKLMEEHKNEVVGRMHGAAVSSIAVGKTIGVAPKAKLYYFAANNLMAGKKEGAEGVYADDYAATLERILEINANLPDCEKIQVVSVSWGQQSNPDHKIPGYDRWQGALKKAKEAGLFVLTTASSREYGLRFCGTGRGDPLSDPDTIESYNKHPAWWSDKETAEVNSQTPRIMPPMDDRTTASPTGKHDYVHYAIGGMSWATPWLAGMFVLARQVDPTVTPEHFWEVALKTGVLSKEVGGSVIQPVKLIETLEKERAQTLKKQQGKTVPLKKKKTRTKGLLIRNAIAREKQRTALKERKK